MGKSGRILLVYGSIYREQTETVTVYGRISFLSIMADPGTALFASNGRLLGIDSVDGQLGIYEQTVGGSA